jgi:hypothetical protein
MDQKDDLADVNDGLVAAEEQAVHTNAAFIHLVRFPVARANGLLVLVALALFRALSRRKPPSSMLYVQRL